MFKKFAKKVKTIVRIVKTAIMCCKAEGYVENSVKIPPNYLQKSG